MANNYGDSQNPKSPYVNKGAQTPAAPRPAAALPEVKILFFVLSSVTRKDINDFIKSSMTWLQMIWKPKDDDLKKFAINLTWDKTCKTIPDKNSTYRRIEFRTNEGSPIALQLVKENYSNPKLEPQIPVFVCEAAWDEQDDKGKPHDGLLRGFTLVRTLRWFKGERAILLFSSAARSMTLAHQQPPANWRRTPDFGDERKIILSTQVGLDAFERTATPFTPRRGPRRCCSARRIHILGPLSHTEIERDTSIERPRWNMALVKMTRYKQIKGASCVRFCAHHRGGSSAIQRYSSVYKRLQIAPQHAS